MTRTRTIVFDVNDTLTDQHLFADRFSDVGAPELLAQTWYAATLRDGIASSLLGAAAPYADVARSVLLGLLATVESLTLGLDLAADHVMAGFDHIDPHPDVIPGLQALAEAGHTLVTLSNGSVDVATGMLDRNGIRDCVAHVLSAQDVGVWKPHPRTYDYAARRTATAAAELIMVAVHPWDLEGASRAGLSTIWVNRTAVPWPAVFSPPEIRVRDLLALHDHLSSL